MAYIYKITNTLNSKVYIGKTEQENPYDRWIEHIKDSKKERCKERPLYRAMNKYGIAIFTFAIIEETANPCEREQYWIQYYGSYGQYGYNATLGGDGKKYLDYDKIKSDYALLQNIPLTAKQNNCSVDSVQAFLKKENIPIKPAAEISKEKNSKKVLMKDKNSLETLNTFDSQMEAARFLIENGYSKSKSASSLSSNVSRVCQGERKTCGGFSWSYY